MAKSEGGGGVPSFYKSAQGGVRPIPMLGRVGRLFSKKQSVGQLSHQKSLRHYLTRDSLPTEGHYRSGFKLFLGHTKSKRILKVHERFKSYGLSLGLMECLQKF